MPDTTDILMPDTWTAVGTGASNGSVFTITARGGDGEISIGTATPSEDTFGHTMERDTNLRVVLKNSEKAWVRNLRTANVTHVTSTEE